MNEHPLITQAKLARAFAYVPYSKFAVGAALLAADGTVFTGCNVENASYGVTCCAERTALLKAVSKGVRRFAAIAIVGAPVGEDPSACCVPCGICRQALAEFCTDELRILFADGSETTLGSLLPHAFRLEESAHADV